MAKTVVKKASKNAGGDGKKAAGNKPAKTATKSPVKKTKRNEEKTPEKKTGRKSGVTEEKTLEKIPVKKAVPKEKKEKKPPAEQPVKTEAPEEDMDSEADPVDEGLRLIQSKPEGILQSELWKELGVDSRKCSRIVKRLEESGLIERVDFKREGIKTYLLRAKQQPVNPADLLAGDELIPCIGCELECVVEECHPLMDWMYQLAIVQHSDE
ncbi:MULTISPECIES: helix-turn-helix transcriptional regulator [unclassified Methanoregula]|uniref:helix-turn-helix transcriptional regulator n=1 Tax=unclassified Methanoregula TaxID=2649730 RepID=UPI0009C6B822|nr:MAG: B-block binding subunit of TFIIIC [Methanoregula sp. PtaB.Bin085]OPY32148.1 MAG: B-block binding subunit of TFIIIC [Methanoregula sp. PtaU1.Bin006]